MTPYRDCADETEDQIDENMTSRFARLHAEPDNHVPTVARVLVVSLIVVGLALGIIAAASFASSAVLSGNIAAEMVGRK